MLSLELFPCSEKTSSGMSQTLKKRKYVIFSNVSAVGLFLLETPFQCFIVIKSFTVRSP